MEGAKSEFYKKRVVKENSFMLLDLIVLTVYIGIPK